MLFFEAHMKSIVIGRHVSINLCDFAVFPFFSDSILLSIREFEFKFEFEFIQTAKEYGTIFITILLIQITIKFVLSHYTNSRNQNKQNKTKTKKTVKHQNTKIIETSSSHTMSEKMVIDEENGTFFFSHC